MTDDLPDVTIRCCTGSFNFADPNETQTMVKVKIPKYSFDHEFSFGEDFVFHDDDWAEQLSQITTESVRILGDREPQRQLEDIVDEHYEDISEAWRQHRIEEIETKIATLKQEKRRL